MENPTVWTVAAAEFAPAQQPPLPTPRNVDADARGEHCITLTWDPICHADCYVVFRSECAGGPYVPIARTYEAAYTDKGLPRDSAWFYRVAAQLDEQLGPKSAFAAATTCPGCCCHLPR